MIQYLDTIDCRLTMAINGWNSAYADQAMWLVSSRLSWLLILIAFLFTLRNKGWRQAVIAIVAVALTVLIADQLSSGIIKPLVERLRPSHCPALASTLHTVNDYRGGMYGFASSHAANSFGIALIISLMMRSRPATTALTLWAMLQCYSRIYLGVHYLGDIAAGTIIGLLAAWVVYKILKWLYRHTPMCPQLPRFKPADGEMLTAAVAVTIITIFVSAIFMVSLIN